VTEVILLLAIVATGTGGELCLARAMRGMGEVTDFHPSTLLHTIGRALGTGWLWLGIALLTIELAALLAMLSVENVSFVIPMTALSYVVGAMGGAFFLGERVGPARWMGVLTVCAGVALVFAGRR
jgi:drug/metabolite transporter (DMT)-like permease